MNIIVLVCDALRAHNLGCYGYDKNTSPQIDKIAERGIRFSNAFSTANSTDASFTTIFTGKYPTSHGICHHGNKVTETEKSYTTNLTFLPELLHERGYVTIGIDWLGKWHKWGYDFYGGVKNDLYSRGEADSGENYKEDVHQSKKLYSDLRKYLSDFSLIRTRCNWYYSLPRSARKYIRSVYQLIHKKLQRNLSSRKSRSIVTDSSALTDLAIEYIQTYAGQKDFFLFVHYWDTHTPYTTPRSIVKDFLRKYHYSDRKVTPILEDLSGTKSARIIKKATRGKTPRTIGEIIAHYDASIRYTDSNIGRLYRFLDEKKILDDTLIIITADHGESLDEHEIYFNHHGLYDQQIKVPLIIHKPDISPGIVYDEFVQHFDIVPTILDITGIKDTGIKFDGKSLLNLIQDEKNWNRKYVFAEETLLQQKRIIRDKNYKYIQALNKDKCLYCQRYHSKEDEFYNLQIDPQEENNILSEGKHIKYKDELEKYINTLAKPEEGREVTFDDEEVINKRLEALGYL